MSKKLLAGSGGFGLSVAVLIGFGLRTAGLDVPDEVMEAMGAVVGWGAGIFAHKKNVRDLMK